MNAEHKLMDNKSLLSISLYMSISISIFLYLSLSLLKLKIALTQLLENAPLIEFIYKDDDDDPKIFPYLWFSLS